MSTTRAGQLNTTVTTPRGRNSFPHIFEPQLNKLSGKMEFSVQILFEPGANLVELQTACKNACINTWGADQAKWPKPLRLPFKSQKDLIASAVKKEQNHDHLSPAATYLSLKTSAVGKTGKPNPHPKVVGKNPKEEIVEESKLYAGCWIKANVTAGAYQKGANAGVTFYLNAVQFVGDADPFSGRPSVETAFEAIPEDPSTDGGDATSMFT